MTILKNQVSLLVILLSMLMFGGCLQFNPLQQNKYGNTTILNTTCNVQTQIDFFFGTQTQLACTAGNTVCSLSNGNTSTMKFLDIMGNDLTLSLKSAEYTSYDFQSGPQTNTNYFVFIFETDDAIHKVNVIVPVTHSLTTITQPYLLKIPLLNQTLQQPFTNLNGLSDISSGLALSTFNFMNLRDYSRFYHATNTNGTDTVLLSIMKYQTANLISNSITDSIISGLTLNYAKSGNKLCFGSNQVEGIFQTHLRESWPLWTAWFAILFFWLYNLIAPANTNQCFDKRFDSNKMTCWGFYSVHFIGHEEFFTRLSRTTLMLINFTIQGVILAAIFMTQGPLNPPSMIIWAAVIAVVATHPVPYFFGCVFLNKISQTTLQKFKVMKKSRATAVKQNQQDSIFQKQIDKLEQRLFSLNYWYYIVAAALFIGLWPVSVHLIKTLHRNFYEQQHYWISALACAFVIENLIVEPILAALFGNMKIYRMRGYYYNSDLGEQYKEIQD